MTNGNAENFDGGIDTKEDSVNYEVLDISDQPTLKSPCLILFTDGLKEDIQISQADFLNGLADELNSGVDDASKNEG